MELTQAPRNSGLLQIIDKQQDKIVGTLSKDAWVDATVTRNINNVSAFDFVALDKLHLLEGRNRIVIPARTGGWEEYIIRSTEKLSGYEMHVETDGSYVDDLRKARPLSPQSLPGSTPETAAAHCLASTGWEPGDIEWVGVTRTITIDDYTDPYEFLGKICTTFGLEMRFRLDIQGNIIKGRYVDLVKSLDIFRGREIEAGKDLLGLQRFEDSDNIVTALICIGPDPGEDKPPIMLTVEDEDALARWGRGGNHLWAIYSPETEDAEMTEARLRSLGQTELKKRINAAVRYEVDAVSHSDMRLGETVRVKDNDYNPPLYLEARIRETEEDPKTWDVLTFKVGDFIEHKKEDLEKQIAALRSIIQQKASDAKIRAELEAIQEDFEASLGLREPRIPVGPNPPADPKVGDKWIDSTAYPNVLKTYDGVEWKKASPTEAKDIGAETPQGAAEKADAAEKAAVDKAAQDATDKATAAEKAAVEKAAEDAAKQALAAETSAKEYAKVQAAEERNAAIITAAADAKAKADKALADAKTDAQAKASAAQAAAITEATAKADAAKAAAIKDVEDKLAAAKTEINTAVSAKADKTTTYTKSEVDNALKSKASTTTVDTLTGRVSTAETTLNQQATEIASKASQSTVDTLTGRVKTAETTITQQAGLISSKAEKTYVDTVSGVANSAKTTAEQTAEGLKTKAEISTVNSLTGRVSTAESTLTQQAKEISSKVSQTDYNALSGRVSTAESKITQQAGLIESKVDATYVQGQLAGVGEGGRNLATGTTSDSVYVIYGMSGTKALVDEPTSPSGKAVKITVTTLGATNTNKDAMYVSTGKLVGPRLMKGVEYTFSFIAKASKDTRLYVRSMNEASITRRPAMNLTSEYQLFSFSFKPLVEGGKASNHNTHFTVPDGILDGTEIYLQPVMIQRGSVAGDWIPSPEDTDQIMTTLSSVIIQNQEAIRLRATKTELDAVSGRVSTAEGKITTMAGQIEAKAEKTVTDGLTTRMNTAESKISANEAAITQRATTTTVNALTTRVQTAENTISAQEAAIKNKAEISVTNGLNSRLQTAEQTISAQDKTIQSKVSQTDFNAMAGRVSTAETAITQSQRAIELRVSQETFDAFANSQENLVRNPAKLTSRSGWSTGTIETVDFFGQQTQALAVTSSGSTQVYSDYFNVDPSKAYEVTMWLKSETPAPSANNAYIGLNGNTAFEQIIASSGGTAADSSNFYFWYAGGTTNLSEWTKYTGYVLPVGFDAADAKGLGSVIYHARMKPGTNSIRVRFLNWSNTTARKMWMTNAYVREVSPALLAEGVRKNSIVSSINLTPESVKIAAEKISLDGDVDILNGKTRVKNFSFDAGQGGILTLGGQNNVHGRLQVLDANGDTVADLDASTGGFAELAIGYLTAPNKAEYVNFNEVESDFHVATAWGGSTGVSGEPSDENDGRGFATPLASINEVIRRLPQVFDGTVNIRLANGQVFDERVNLRGFSGNGTINIFCASATGTSTINGEVKAGRGGVHVTMDRIKLNHTTSGSMAVEVTAGLAHIRNCDIRGNADTLVGVDANYGGFAYVTDCTINGCNVGVRAIYGGIMRSWNNRGRNRTNGIESNGGILIASGTQPAGDVANVKTYNNGFQQSNSTTFPDAAVAPPPPPPKQTTVKWDSTGGNTYRVTQGYWDTQWALANVVAQGRWDANTGLTAGAWFFGSGPSVAAGKNIKSIKVYIKREAAGGLGGAVTVTLRPHAYTTRPSGAPSFLAGSQNVSLSRGEGKWVTLPSSFHTAFRSGGARGIGVQTTSTSQSNYARLVKAAALEITYE